MDRELLKQKINKRLWEIKEEGSGRKVPEVLTEMMVEAFSIIVDELEEESTTKPLRFL